LSQLPERCDGHDRCTRRHSHAALSIGHPAWDCRDAFVGINEQQLAVATPDATPNEH
jgi:hypothetical protein